MDMQLEHAARTCSMDKWQQDAALTFRMEKQQRIAAQNCGICACSGDVQQGHAVWTCIKVVQQGSVGFHFKDMQHGYLCSKDMTCSIYMGMQHGHVHAAWTWACSMDMRMQPGHAALNEAGTSSMYIK
jgi:hypothetical protein